MLEQWYNCARNNNQTQMRSPVQCGIAFHGTILQEYNGKTQLYHFLALFGALCWKKILSLCQHYKYWSKKLSWQGEKILHRGNKTSQLNTMHSSRHHLFVGRNWRMAQCGSKEGHSSCLESLCGDFLHIAVLFKGAIWRRISFFFFLFDKKNIFLPIATKYSRHFKKTN